MKKAKVSKGLVHHVWPSVKTLPDGTKVTKVLPDCYRGLNGKPVPECIVDVPDNVKPGWLWNGKKYAARVKPTVVVKAHSDLLEVVAEKLGVPYQQLWDEVLARKKARRRAAKTD